MARRVSKHEPRHVENNEYIAFASRILRAMGRRAATDIESLTELAKLRDELDEQLNRAILACHAEGYSYNEIGDRMGVTRQAIYQRLNRIELRELRERVAAAEAS